MPLFSGCQALTQSTAHSTPRGVWKSICRSNRKRKLKALAAQTGGGTDQIVQEAVAQLLTHNEWFRAQVKIGIEQIARGEFLERDGRAG